MSPKVMPKDATDADYAQFYADDIEPLYQKERDRLAAEEYGEWRQSLNRQIQVEMDRRRMHELLADISPYGPTSPHSWLLDSASAAGKGMTLPDVRERLDRFHAAQEKIERFAVGTGTLGGLLPATIEPYVAEAVSYGVRSTAPLAAALLNLPLPPVGMNVAWAKVTTAATVTNQSAENTAMTASADVVVGSATDPLGTIGASLAFSAQSLERSGGWFDRVLGEELGRAFGARLEQQIWAGTGANQQLKGFTVMTGNSSSTVSGQTFPLTVNKIADQYQQVATNLGQTPDLLAIAPRRYSALEMGTGALGLEVNSIVPVGMDLVVSPAAPLTLGGGTEDWLLLIRRDSTPLVAADAPTIEFQQQTASGTSLTFQVIVYGYAALGSSRRPEGVGIVKGLTPPTFT
jgi:Phage capsid family